MIDSISNHDLDTSFSFCLKVNRFPSSSSPSYYPLYSGLYAKDWFQFSLALAHQASFKFEGIKMVSKSKQWSFCYYKTPWLRRLFTSQNLFFLINYGTFRFPTSAIFIILYSAFLYVGGRISHKTLVYHTDQRSTINLKMDCTDSQSWKKGDQVLKLKRCCI